MAPKDQWDYHPLQPSHQDQDQPSHRDQDFQ